MYGIIIKEITNKRLFFSKILYFYEQRNVNRLLSSQTK